MPRKENRKRQKPDHQLLVFEIKAWEPSYSFSLNRKDDLDSDYCEYAELHLETACVYPDALADRSARMIFSSRRGLLDIPDPRRDESEKPKDVGLLQLPPSGGNFYAGVPHDTVPFLMSAIALERFRYVMIAGPSLKRSHSLPTEIYFSRTAD